jgi:hypothetical protein
MRKSVRRVIRDEKGAALALVLVLLVVGGLILTPLLGLMTTGLISGQVYEKKTAELYAADAGVEDAIWRIQTNNITFVNNCSEPWLLTVNDKSVQVIVYRKDVDPTPCGQNFTYQVLSTAVTDDVGGTAAMGGSTTIDAQLSVSYLYMDFSPLLDYAIVSNSTIGIQQEQKPHVVGDVWLPEKAGLDGGEAITGIVYDSSSINVTWPGAAQLSTYYLQDVVGAPDPGKGYSIDGQAKTEGPWHRKGNLAVDNIGGSATLALAGTVYVDGNLNFEQPGGSSYTVELNGQTIFVGGNITFPSNHVSISGSGCIIAVGNVDFQPGMASDGDDFVLVMSVTGAVTFQPNGEFTGCVAGDKHVQLKPNADFHWTSLDGIDLNFPTGADDDKLPPVTGLTIESWEIK